MAQRSDDDMTISAGETVTRANQMADVLEVGTSSFRGREPEAYAVLSHVYAMPRLQSDTDRHRYGIEILGFTNKVFPYAQPENGEFFRAIQVLVVTMQEFPAWFHDRRGSTS
jgi:hypothetical protein